MRIRVIKKKLGRENACGEATLGTSTIYIDPRTTTHGGNKAYLGTLIHEALHLLNPDYSETEVIRQEAAIAQLLWKEGYRRTDQ